MRKVTKKANVAPDYTRNPETSPAKDMERPHWAKSYRDRMLEKDEIHAQREEMRHQIETAPSFGNRQPFNSGIAYQDSSSEQVRRGNKA